MICWRGNHKLSELEVWEPVFVHFTRPEPFNFDLKWYNYGIALASLFIFIRGLKLQITFLS